MLVSVTPVVGANIIPSSWTLSLLDQDGNGITETAKLNMVVTNTPDNVRNLNDVVSLFIVTQIIYNTSTVSVTLPAPVAAISYALTTLSLPATPSLTLLIPALTLQLLVSVTKVEALQTVHVTINVGATSSPSPGYDIDIASIIPPQLHVVANSLAITGSGEGEIVFNGNGANSANVSAGFVVLLTSGTISVQFDATVDTNVLSGTLITLPASLFYCSSPAAYGRACYTAATSEVLNVNPPNVTIAVYNTSLAETAGSNVAIGELVVYHANLTYPKGNAFNGVLTITLPTAAAQQIVWSTSIVFVGANINISAGAIATGVDGGQDTVTYTIPSVRNDPSQSNTDGNIIIFEIFALVTNSSSNVNLATSPTTASLAYYSSSYSASTSVKVILPSLTITKTHVAAAYVDAYSYINYTLTIAHSGSSSSVAYNTTIDDFLPLTLSLVEASVTVSVSATSSVTVLSSGTSLHITIGNFLLGSPSIVVHYSTIVQPSVLASQLIVNNANTTYISAPATTYNTGNIRSFATLTSHSVLVAAPALSFDLGLLSTSLTETPGIYVAVGETITIPMEITVPRGITKNAYLSVALPYTVGKLKAIYGTVVVIPPYTSCSLAQGASAGLSDSNTDTIPDDITFSLGDITNNPSGATNSTITLLVAMLVSADILTNNGDNLTTTATLLYSNGTSTLSISASFSVVVVEPALALTNLAVTTYTAHIGSGTVVKYTLTLTNAGGSTGPSYYVEVYDALDPRLSLLNGTVTTTSGTVTTGNAPGDAVVRVNPSTLLSTQSVTITFNATILDTVQAATSILNTATYKYTSALYQTYNSDDVRNRSGTANSTVTATAPVVDFTLNYTTVPDTNGYFVTIGEAASIVTTLSVPKGTTSNSVLTLAVPKTTVKLDIVYARIAFLEPSLGITAFTVGQYVHLDDTNTDTYNDTTILNFGLIFNPSYGVEYSKPTVAAIVEFIGLVVNIPANINSSSFASTANFAYGTGLTLPPKYVTLVEVLPSLSISKTASVPSTYIEAGSSIQYTVVISHVSGSASPAYNTLVIDPLSPLLRLQPSTVTASAGAVVVVGQTQGDTYIKITSTTLLVGSSITIKYNTTYTDVLPPSSPVVNTVNATYYTAPDGLWNAGNIRSATVLSSAIVNTAVPTVALVLNSTSISQTPGSNVTVGETISFLATVQIPHGITQSATLTVSLPASSAGKLGAIRGRIASMSSYLTSSLSRSQGYAPTPTDSQNTDGILDTVTFSFGTLTNPFDGTFKSSNGSIVVEVFALVVNDITNINLASLRTSASFAYSNGTRSFTAGPSNVDVTVVLPSISLVKTPSVPTYTEAGSVVTYTLTIRHLPTSTSPAFNLTVADLLSSPYLALVSGSVRVSAGTVATGNSASDTVIYVNPPTILLTDVITVTYNATLAASTISDSSVPNTATVSYSSALSTVDNNNGKDVRYNTTSGSALVSIASPSFTFAVNSVSLTDISIPNVTIGETVALRVTITVPAGFTDAAVLTVTLPNGAAGQLSAVYGSVVSVPAAINATYTSGAVVSPTQHLGFNDTVTFSFGTFSNPHDSITQGPNDKIIVDIIALVVNSSVNTAGSLTPSAVFSFSNGATVISLGPKTVTLSVVLPQLAITKVAHVSSTYLQAGDVVQYTVTVSHTGASKSPAYKPSVTDLLSTPNLKLVAGSVTSSKGSGSIITGNTGGDSTIVVIPTSLLLTDAPLIITYNATLTSAVETQSLVYNYASATYYSSTTNPYNNNNIRIATVTTDATVLVSSPNITFALTTTSLAETTGYNVAISETVTFTGSIVFPHGTTYDAVLQVVLPFTAGKLQLVSSSVSYLPANTQSSLLSLGSVGVGSDSNADGINDLVTFNFGTVVSAPSSNADTNRVSVEVVALVVDVASNVAGTVLSSDAVLTYSASAHQITSSSVNVVIVEPQLGVTQVCAPTSGDSSDVVTCTVSVSHLSSVAAYNVILSNIFAPGTLALVSQSVTTSLGTVTTGNTHGDTTFSVLVGVLVSSSNFTVTYQATLTDLVQSSGTTNVTTTLTYHSGTAASRSYTTDAQSTISILPASLSVTVDSTSLASTLNKQVTIGETVTFLATISLARGITTVPVLTFTTGSALGILQAKVVSLGNSASCTTVPTGTLSGTSSVSFNFGAELCNSASGTLGGNVVVQIVAVVNDINANVAGATLPVQAQLVYGNSVTLAASNSVVVVEPALTLSKTTDISVIGGDYSDNITYTINISHTAQSSSYAYDLSLNDSIPSNLQLIASTVQVSSGSVSLGSNSISVSIGSIPSGSTFTLTYTTTLLPFVLSGAVITNNADLVYASAPSTNVPFVGAARTYTDHASANVFVGDPIISSFIVYNQTLGANAPNLTTSPESYYFSVGEVVTFHLTASVPNDPSAFIYLAQNLPSASFSILSVSAILGATVTVGSSATNRVGDTIWYNFTSITNPLVGNNEGGTITLEVQVVVADVSANHNGATFTTAGSLFSVLANSTRSITLVVVEADLAIATSASAPTPTFVEAGNVVTYTTSISHSATSASTAYIVTFADTLSSYVSLVVGSVSSSVGTVTVGNNAGDTGVAVSVSQLALNQVISVTYQATIVPSAIVSSAFANNASLVSQSAPSTIQNVGAVRVVSETPVQATLTLASPSFSFVLASTSASSPVAPLVTIGETAVFTVLVTLPLGTIPDTTVSVSFAHGAAGVLALTGASSSSLTATSHNSLIQLIDTDGDSTNDTAVFNFGTISNSDGAALGASATLSLTLSALVPDVTVNVPGTSLVSTTTFTYNNASTSITLLPSAVTLPIAGPALTWSVTYNTTQGQAGDVVAGYLTISHDLSSTAPAYDVDISTSFPNLDVAPGSIIGTRALSAVPFANSPSSSAWSYLAGVQKVAVGDFVGINFTGVLNTAAVISSYINLSLANTYSSSASFGHASHSAPLSTLFAILPPPSFNLTLASTSNPEVSGNVVLVGENATFVVTVTIPYGTILDPSLTLRVKPTSNTTLILLASSVAYVANTTTVQNLTNALSNATSTIAYESLVNQPNGPKKLIFSFDSVVLPTNVTAGTNLTVESQLSYNNGTQTFTQPIQNSTLVVAIASFGFIQTCSIKVSAKGVAQCMLTVYPRIPIPAYNLTISNTETAFFTLNANSVNSSHGSVTYDNKGGFSVAVPVYNPALGANITILYSTTLTAQAKTNTDVVVPALLHYLSSPTIYAASTLQNASAVIEIRSGGSGLSAGAISGIVIGSVGGAAIIGAGAAALFKKKAFPIGNPFVQSASLNPSATVEDNPIFEGDRFAPQNNPLYQNAV